MKIKAKGKETMFWCHVKNEMVSFKNGVADVPKDIGNAMIKNYGYEEFVENLKDKKPEGEANETTKK